VSPNITGRPEERLISASVAFSITSSTSSLGDVVLGAMHHVAVRVIIEIPDDGLKSHRRRPFSLCGIIIPQHMGKVKSNGSGAVI
jgi:hypothetical protein